MRHHFHCTDGWELILDPRGRPMRADDDTRKQAEAVARRLMSEVLISADWSRWMVCIHNNFGEQVDVLPFPAPERISASVLPFQIGASAKQRSLLRPVS